MTLGKGIRAMRMPRPGMGLPLDVRDVSKSGTRYTQERELPLRVAVYVEPDAPDVLIDTVQQNLRPRTAKATLQVEVAEHDATPPLEPLTDVVVVLAGSGGPGVARAVDAARDARVPVVVVALGDAAHGRELADAVGLPAEDVIACRRADEVIERLGSLLSEKLRTKRLALAQNFPFVRRAVAEDAVKTTAWQNAMVGVMTPVAGADMPIMTANQAKMLLQIAAAYGEPLGMDRVKELLAVVGGGYLMRAIARQALAFVPVLGWAVKGGVAYAGTMAMGKTAVEYFEQGRDLSQIVQHFREVVASAPSKGSHARAEQGVEGPSSPQPTLFEDDGTPPGE